MRLALSLVGLALALYLTVLHYDRGIPLVCGNSGIINCEAVITSPRSVILGVPIALFGVLWFLVHSLLSLLSLRRNPDPDESPLGSAMLLWSAVGAASVVYLVYVELLVIGKLCLWCSMVHIAVLALLALQVRMESDRVRDIDR